MDRLYSSQRELIQKMSADKVLEIAKTIRCALEQKPDLGPMAGLMGPVTIKMTR